MNDLALYHLNKKDLAVGDVVIFYGEDPLEAIIRKVTKGGPGHCAIVRQPLTADADVVIIESTILNGRDGVQNNFLGPRIANYGAGATVACLRQNPQTRQMFDLEKFYAFCGSAEGHVRYDLADLFEFLPRMIPGIGNHIFQGENPDAMVCSAWVTAALIASSVLPLTINWAKQSPQSVVESYNRPGWPLWADVIPLLGDPPVLRLNGV